MEGRGLGGGGEVEEEEEVDAFLFVPNLFVVTGQLFSEKNNFWWVPVMTFSKSDSSFTGTCRDYLAKKNVSGRI